MDRVETLCERGSPNQLKASALPWLWRRPAAAAPARSLDWELPYAVGTALDKQTNKNKNQLWLNLKQQDLAFSQCPSHLQPRERSGSYSSAFSIPPSPLPHRYGPAQWPLGAPFSAWNTGPLEIPMDGSFSLFKSWLKSLSQEAFLNSPSLLSSSHIPLTLTSTCFISFMLLPQMIFRVALLQVCLPN